MQTSPVALLSDTNEIIYLTQICFFFFTSIAISPSPLIIQSENCSLECWIRSTARMMWDKCSRIMERLRNAQCFVIRRDRAKAVPLLRLLQNNLPLVLSRWVLISASKKNTNVFNPPFFFDQIFQALHQSQTMEGCSAPIVVKFADTQKEKDAKRIQALQSSLWNFASTLNSPMPTSPVPIASPIQSSMPTTQQSPFLASDAVSASNSLQLLQQIQAIGLQNQLLHGKLCRHSASS